MYQSRVFVSFVVAVVVSLGMYPRTAAAQDAPPCEQVVDLAETLYQQSRVDEVIALVSDCLSDENVSTSTAVRGYRLMALAYLRNDAVADARLAIIELLGRDPSYQADPVQDLPAYVAMVSNTREQLSLQTLPSGAGDEPVASADSTGNGAILPDDTPPGEFTSLRVPSYLRSSDMSVRGRLGWSSYGGERGVTGGGVFGEFVDNGGESAAAEIAYSVTNLIAVGLQYHAGRYPTIHDPKGSEPTEDFPAIDKGTSSPWMHAVGLLVRGAVPSQSVVRPYGALGFFTTFSLINDKVSVGGGPKLAVGVDVSVSPDVGLFFEIEQFLLLPGDSSDLTDRQYPYDLFSGAALGVRYVVGAK